MRTKETEDAERVRKQFEPNAMISFKQSSWIFSHSARLEFSYSMQVSTGKQHKGSVWRAMKEVWMSVGQRACAWTEERESGRYTKLALRHVQRKWENTLSPSFDPRIGRTRSRIDEELLKYSRGHAAINGSQCSFFSKSVPSFPKNNFPISCCAITYRGSKNWLKISE